MNSNPSMLLPLALALAVLATACRPQHQVPVNETALESRPSDEGPVSRQKGNSSSTEDALFITDVDAPLTTDQAFTEVSILAPHKALLRLNALTPGRVYTAHWELFDASGSCLMKDDNFAFTPTESTYFLFYTFKPNYKVHEPGRWKWVVKVDKVGRFTTQFTALPPTPSDLKELARYEQAREEVLKAFANYWLGYSNTFLTVVIDERWKEPSDRDGHTSRPPAIPALLQVSGLGYLFHQDLVSDADRQNGITYRGRCDVRFDTWRYWTDDAGWIEWRDTEEYQNESLQALMRMMGETTPVAFRDRFCLQYQIQQKDNHWRVTTDTGDLFVNGTLAGSTNLLGRLQTLAQPRLESVRALAFLRGNQRVRDWTLGNQLRASPEEIDRNTINTMSMLRGRSL